MAEQRNPYIIILMLTIIVLMIFVSYLMMSMHMLTQKQKKNEEEPFCNCFAAQYDGSPGKPAEKCYYGGYCYDKEKITKLYDAGAFSTTFAGV